jgi:hypothetical protein
VFKFVVALATKPLVVALITHEARRPLVVVALATKPLAETLAMNEARPLVVCSSGFSHKTVSSRFSHETVRL